MRARSRRPEAETWERDNHRRFYAARKGNGALDTVWSQAFRNERAAQQDMKSAAVLIDYYIFTSAMNC